MKKVKINTGEIGFVTRKEFFLIGSIVRIKKEDGSYSEGIVKVIY